MTKPARRKQAEAEIMTTETLVAQCLKRGMKPPLVVCAVSPNGSLMATRVTPDGEPNMLAEHFEPEGVAEPFTIMVLDQDNEAACFIIETTGKKTWQ
jgi:hypothetical protein